MTTNEALTTGAVLDKATILAADDRRTVDVDVPQWGGTVRLREFSADVRATLEYDAFKQTRDGGSADLKAWKFRVVSESIVDNDGQRMFVTPGEVSALATKSATAIDVIYVAAMELNGMAQTEQAATQDFTETQSSASSTA